ncbi:unnamed protein product [Phyllotreta striolata]|uniref:Uncharacterized protein n=1 Tax=Phyllotreta striolata TaxID=444603 RepID=A0A9P0GS23_PHYSR|nr:unnamed protein product [Phyllotreta striolata]
MDVGEKRRTIGIDTQISLDEGGDLPTPRTIEGFSDEQPFESEIYKLVEQEPREGSMINILLSDDEEENKFKGKRGKRQREVYTPEEEKKRRKEEETVEQKRINRLLGKITEGIAELKALVRQNVNTKREIKDKAEDLDTLARWLSQDISIRRNSLRRSPVCVEKTKGDRGETPTRKLNEKEKEAIIMQDSEESTNLQEKVGSAGKRKKSEMDSPPESGDRAKREKSDEEMMIKSMLRVMKTAKRLKEMIAKTTNTRGDIRQASKDLDYHVDKLSVDLEGWQTNKRVSPRKPVERKEIGTQTEEEYKDTREIGIQACTEMFRSVRMVREWASPDRHHATTRSLQWRGRLKTRPLLLLRNMLVLEHLKTKAKND